jgi:hypothetical protein
MTSTRTTLRRRGTILLVALLGITGCDLELTNPNALTEEEVFTSIDGMLAAAVGMQSEYAGDMDDFIVPAALVTDEWSTQSRALISYYSMVTGENFDRAWGTVEAPWATAYRTINTANNLVASVPGFDLSTGLATGLTAVAKLYKAMAYGSLIMNFESVPIDVTVDAPEPQPRDAVLDTALAELESARTLLGTVTDAQLDDVYGLAIPTGFDLRNTVDAMLARYYLVDGQYQNAIDAAGRVDLGVLSVFTYPPPTRNPIEDLAYQAQYVAALLSWVEQAEAGDERVDYWVDTGVTPFPGNPDSLLQPLRKYSTANEPFPAYLPDEMRLIQAEAHTMLGQLAQARTLVNAVRTQSSSPVDEPVANLPPIADQDLDTEDALLDQIAYERRYELYMQGLRWEDSRRLGAARTTTPTFMWLPIPQQECDANPGRPCG